jgi:hypothetical protein
VAKNRLTASDAKLVEDAFERRLSQLSPSDTASPRRYPTGSTFAMSCNSRASSVAASHPIPRYMQPRDVGVAPGCQRWLDPRLD